VDTTLKQEGIRGNSDNVGSYNVTAEEETAGSTTQPTGKSAIAPTLASLTVGITLGLIAIAYYERRRKFRETWMVSSISSSESGESQMFIHAV
jgi:hypothetical protein